MALLYDFMLPPRSRIATVVGCHHWVITTNDRCSCRHVDAIRRAHSVCSRTFLSWLIKAVVIVRTLSQAISYRTTVVKDGEEAVKQWNTL